MSLSVARGNSSSAVHSAIRDQVARAVRRYLSDMGEAECGDLHGMVMQEVEAPLYSEVLDHCEGNITRAARMAGLHVSNFHRKMEQHHLRASSFKP